MKACIKGVAPSGLSASFLRADPNPGASAQQSSYTHWVDFPPAHRLGRKGTLRNFQLAGGSILFLPYAGSPQCPTCQGSQGEKKGWEEAQRIFDVGSQPWCTAQRSWEIEHACCTSSAVQCSYGRLGPGVWGCCSCAHNSRANRAVLETAVLL